ncbi:hypothetical protein DdX_10052 [Ditylenchus destructor]|uniref:Uncharacterized protein n=1 Tax=Ditylenchus destructor TaxID=166010 RepID=A0AAD4MYJ0_9BILA|nr:hypothetical protein DdX_10052 [Ditylenchus destructor]
MRGLLPQRWVLKNPDRSLDFSSQNNPTLLTATWYLAPGMLRYNSADDRDADNDEHSYREKRWKVSKGVDFGRLREAARSTAGRSHPVMSWGDVLLDRPGRTPPAPLEPTESRRWLKLSLISRCGIEKRQRGLGLVLKEKAARVNNQMISGDKA